MELTRGTRLVILVLQVLATWVPAIVYAGCASACPFGDAAAGHRCSLPSSAAPAVRMASCCETLQTAAEENPAQGVVRAAAAFASPALPAELPIPPVAAAMAAAPPPSPPPLYEGIGLYTLHAAFLI